DVFSAADTSVCFRDDVGVDGGQRSSEFDVAPDYSTGSKLMMQAECGGISIYGGTKLCATENRALIPYSLLCDRTKKHRRASRIGKSVS
ncbi:MAG: hypothetical protein K9L75_05320, partial [Spirochaetia bacterium]|nr:hypothetical protein [Spirochaetia bacterium]